MQMDKTLKQLFNEAMLELPEEDRCYLDQPMCLQENDGYKCSKRSGHSGDHCAHATLGHIVRRWA